MRERKRYVAFEVISKKPLKGYFPAYKAIEKSMLRLYGIMGLAGAGLKSLSDHWDPKSAKGLVRVSHTFTDQLKSAMAMTKEIDGQGVSVRSLGVSGVIAKADERYIRINTQGRIAK